MIIGDGKHAQLLRAMFGPYKIYFHIVAIGDNKTRKEKWESLEHEHCDYMNFGTIVDAEENYQEAFIGSGTVVMPKATLMPFSVIGDNCIINTGAIIEHHAEIGDHCHVAPGAVVLGGAKLGEGVFVGANAVVVQEVEVPDWTFIKANSVYKGE